MAVLILILHLLPYIHAEYGQKEEKQVLFQADKGIELPINDSLVKFGTDPESQLIFTDGRITFCDRSGWDVLLNSVSQDISATMTDELLTVWSADQCESRVILASQWEIHPDLSRHMSQNSTETREDTKETRQWDAHSSLTNSRRRLSGCYDAECSSCVDALDGSCDPGSCNVSNGMDDPDNAGFCLCQDMFSREDTDSGVPKDTCQPCHTGCGVCTYPISNDASFRYCTQCALTMKQTDTPIYCFDECPTGYDETAALDATVPATCALGAGGAKVVLFVFDKPTHAYTNTGAAEAGESAGRKPVWTVTRDAPGGTPAKYRGIYFDSDTDNYAQITLMNFNRIVSVHQWMMLKRVNVKQTAWSVDRNTWGVSGAQRNIDAFINASNDLELCVARDDDYSNFTCVTQGVGLSANTWRYIAWVLEDSSGYYLALKVYVNSVFQMNDSVSDICFKDNTSWPMNIAIQRESNGSGSPQFVNKFQGFISMVAIWQETSNGTGDHWVSGGADACSDCDTFDCAVQSTTCLWTEDFDKFQDWWSTGCSKASPCTNRSCDASCSTTGCVSHEVCKTETQCAALASNTGDQYCNLCYDRQCANCATYGIDDCSVCGGNATIDGTACVCDSQYGRIQSDAATSTTYLRGYYCRQCWRNCETCERINDSEASSVENYTKCYECKTAPITSTGFLDSSNIYYCQTEEPTANNWTNCKGTPSATDCAALSYTFVNSFGTFDNAVAAAGTDPQVSVTVAAPSGLAGSYRGIWFATSNTARIGFDAAFVLRNTFTIYSWVWYDHVYQSMTLFSKDRNASGSYVYKAAINSSSYMQVSIYKDSNGSDGVTVTSSPNAIYDRAWVWISTSNDCINHEDTVVRMYRDTTLIATQTVSDRCLDDEGSWYTGAFIGSERTAVSADVFANQFSGFIYDFHLYQRVYDATEQALYRKTASCGWSTSVCPDTLDGVLKWEANGANDMWQTYYNTWTNSVATCDASCTTTYSPSTGCNSEAHCIDPSTCDNSAASGTECHMCYDYHCSGCSDHHSGSCDSCRGAATHDAGTGKCDCANNLMGEKYTRQDRTQPCCARHCRRCSLEVEGIYCLECCAGDTTGSDGECTEAAKAMPGHTIASNGFVICNLTCPSGFNNSVNPCSLLHTTNIVDWDLTWIERPIYNYASNFSTTHTPDVPPGGWTQFGDALPYKLRGSWFGSETTQRVLVVTDSFQFHHTFTMAFWLKMEATSGDQTIFSKDKGDPYVNGTSDENVWEYRLNGGSAILAIWNGGTGAWENVTSASAYAADTNWYFLAFSVSYDGTVTTAKLYKNTESSESIDFANNVYVNDRQNWDGSNNSTFLIGSSRSTSGSDPTPETPFTGFIFYTKIWVEERSQADIQSLIEGTASNCLGACASGYCPTPSSWYVSQLNYCLWETNRDKWESYDGTAVDCYIKATTDACPAVQGCVRGGNCNRCQDPLCKRCNTFDNRGEYCIECIDNASKQANNACGCDEEYQYSTTYPLADPGGNPPDYTDKCIPCDVVCKTCSSNSYKECTQCKTGYYLQEKASMCLNFCPTGYSDTTTEVCLGSPNDAVVFKLKLQNWSEDFKSITELIGGEDILQLGDTSAWAADDPWFDRAVDRGWVLFTAANNQHIKILNAASGLPGLLISQQFTIKFWINPNVVIGTQTLLQKTNPSSNVTAIGEEKLIAFGLNAANFQVVFTTSTLNENSGEGVVEDFLENTYVSTGDHVQANSWQMVVITMRSDITADIKMYRNTVQAHYQSPQPDIQYSDKSNSEGTIGCGKEYGNATPINCFDGYIYEMTINAINLAVFRLQSEYGIEISDMPDLTNKCPEKQYYDGTSCLACNTVESDPTKTDTVLECTACGSVLCTQWVGLLDAQCMGCISGYHLSVQPGPASCICINGFYYDADSHSCHACATGCYTCHDAYLWTCTVCDSSAGYYLQPDTYTCADVCPKGYQVSGNTCIQDYSINEDLLLDFEVILDAARKFTYDGVSYDSGADDQSNEADEPWTYKSRGAYFNATEFLHLDGEFYLWGAGFTFYSWLKPEEDGSIFSKSYSDWAEFLDVAIIDSKLSLDITDPAGNNKIATMSDTAQLDVWNFVGFTLNYDKTIGSNICNLQGYLNGITQALATVSPIGVVESSNTDSAIGARLDSDGGSYKVSNLFTGFIYNIEYYGGQIKSSTDMNDMVASNLCLQTCNFCPADTQECFWECAPDEWFNDLTCAQNCEKWPTCADPHPNGWKGCVRGENCALCDDEECETWDGFSSTSTCSKCIADIDGNYSSSSPCACGAGSYDPYTHTCKTWDYRCSTCTALTNDSCSACVSPAKLLTGSTICALETEIPNGFDGSGGTYWSEISNDAAEVLKLLFTEITKGFSSFTLVSTAYTEGVTTVQKLDSQRSMAVKDRGHWFDGDRHWQIVGLLMYHTFTIRAWIRPKLESRKMVLFSNQKQDIIDSTKENTCPTQNLISFYIGADDYLAADIMDKGELKATGQSSNPVTDSKWQLTVLVTSWDETNTTIGFFINTTASSTTTAGKFFLEYENTYKYLGGQMENTGASWAWQPNYEYKGFMNKFSIWNRSMTETADVVIISGDACPDGVCLSECDKGYWVDTDGTCQACDSSCPVDGTTTLNCVRAETDSDCTLCDNRLWLTCKSFFADDDAFCETCIDGASKTGSEITGFDCVCDEYKNAADWSPAQWGCNCDPLCDGCTGPTNYDCTGCAGGDDYFVQLDAPNVCLLYCGFDQSPDGGRCVDDGNDRVVRTLDQIDWTAVGASDPWPMKHRGHYFNGSTHFLADINNVVLHHTMYFDAFLKPEELDKRTVFSRDRNDFSELGAGDFFAWQIEHGGKMITRIKSNFEGDCQGGTGSTQLVHDDVWSYVGSGFTYYNDTVPFTQVYTQTNGVIHNTCNFAGLVEDVGSASGWQSFIGKSRNADGSGGSYDTNLYKGFIYEMGFANKEIDIATVFSSGTACSTAWADSCLVGESCFCWACDNICPSISTFGSCLWTWGIDQFPLEFYNSTSTAYEQECTDCDSTCSKGCTREDTCTLWADIECEQCSDFTSSATCSQCYTGTTLNVDGDCDCDGYTTYHGWYSTVDELCHPWPVECDFCVSNFSRETLMDCGSTCLAGKIQAFGVCGDHNWPAGYATTELQPQQWVDQRTTFDNLILHYKDFITFSATDTDRVLGLVARRGYIDSAGETKYDGYKPRVQIDGGLYFDGSDFLQMPPYDGDANYFIINNHLTIIMIIRPDVWETNPSTENEVLLSKSDGTTDRWVLYLAKDTKQLMLQLDDMQTIHRAGTNSNILIELSDPENFPDDGLWHQLAIQIELSTANSRGLYKTSYWALLDEAWIASATVQNDVYFKDDPTASFIFGGKKSAIGINPSYRGNLFNLKFYSLMKIPTFISQEILMVRDQAAAWCSCNQCYAQFECLTNCQWNEYLSEDQVTCEACSSNCDRGCRGTSTYCGPFQDLKCSNTDYTWEACVTCGSLAELRGQTDPKLIWMCECVENAVFDSTINGCKCNDVQNYAEIETGQCDFCASYIVDSQVSAAYDSTYEFIYVYFSENLRDVELTCDEAIDTSSLLKLGTVPTCEWTHVNTPTNGVYSTLKIKPDVDATFAEEQLEMRTENLYTDTATCPALPTAIEPSVNFSNDTIISPVADFTANTKFSKGCDDLYLNGSASSGGVHRHLIMLWTIVHKATETQVADYLASASLTGTYYETAVVLRNLFINTGEYRVTLNVENWLGQTAEMGLDVTVLPEDTPFLEIVYEGSTRVSKTAYREIEATVHNNCASALQETSETPVYAYTWTQVDGPAPIQGKALQSDTKVMTLYESFSEVGTYIVKVTAVGSGFEGELDITLDVVNTSLICRLSTLSGDVSLKKELILDASKSIDPEGGEIIFEWTCQSKDDDDCSSLMVPQNANGSIQKIPENTMAEDVTYNITIRITPAQTGESSTETEATESEDADGDSSEDEIPVDDRSDSKFIAITARDNNAPSLLFKDIGDRVARQEILRLEVTPIFSEDVNTNSTEASASEEGEDEATEIESLWEQMQGPVIEDSQYITPRTLQYLSIAENTLEEGETYQFSLTFTANGDSATGFIEFTVNQGPRSGSFLVSPEEGVELTTEFNFIASGWIDPEDSDYPLLYGFSYLDRLGEPEWMRTPAEKLLLTNTIPYLDEATVTAQLHVEDSMGTPTYTTIYVGIESLTDAERRKVIEEQINRLEDETDLDAPALINKYAANGQLSNVTQLDLLMDRFDIYLLDLAPPDYTSDLMDSLISAHQKLARTSQAKQRVERLLAYVDNICTISKASNGLSASQVHNMVSSINYIDSTPKHTSRQLDWTLESHMKTKLPSEADFIHETSNLKFNSRRITPSVIAGTEQTFPNSFSKIRFPSNIALKSNNSAFDNTTSIVDAHFIEYPPHVGANGTITSIVDFQLVNVGKYENNEFSYLDQSQILEATTDDWIEIFISVSNISANWNPDCVYASYIDPVSGNETWSPDGCILHRVREIEGTVVCKCNHLSRFTAGENMYEVAIEDTVVTLLDDFSGKSPIMVIFLGILLLIIIITAIAEKVHYRISRVHASIDQGIPASASGSSRDPVIIIHEVFPQSISQHHSRSKTTDTPKKGDKQQSIFDPITILDESKLAEDDMWMSPDSSIQQLKRVNSQEIIESGSPTVLGSPKSALASPQAMMGVPKPAILPYLKNVSQTDRNKIEDTIEPPVKSPKGGLRDSGNSTLSMLGSSDTKDWSLESNKDRKRKVWDGHLLWQKCSNRSPSPTVRALIICSSLILEIMLTGSVYYSQYIVADSYEEDWSFEELSLLRELAVGLVCAISGLSISSIFVIVHSKVPKCGWFLSFLMIFFSSCQIIYMALVFNKVWSMVWMSGWILCAVFDLAIGHLIVMWIFNTVIKSERKEE